MLEKLYSRLNFVNKKRPALNEANLNHIDKAIDDIDNRVININESKFDKDSAKSLVKSVSLDEKTGVLTVVLYDNTTKTYNTNISRIAVNFEYDKDRQVLILILLDGTKTEINLADLITQYEFVDSSTIQFVIGTDGSVSAKIKNNSITEAHLQTDYLANIKVETANSAQNREVAEASAILAKDYAEQAKESAEQALSTTPEGYNQVVEDVDLLKNAIIQTIDRTLYGSKAGGIKLIGIGGASEQKQYSGAQLLDLSKRVFHHNGATLQYTEPKLTLTKTMSNLNCFIAYSLGEVEQFAGKTIYMSGSYEGRAWRVALGYAEPDNTNRIIGTQKDGTTTEFSNSMLVDADTYAGKELLVWLYVDVLEAGEVGDTGTYSNVMVSTEENADYEPYVGATPSPNPIYPQEIESVGDMKNLLPPREGMTEHGITYSVDDKGVITANGATTADADSYEFAYFDSKTELPEWLEKGVEYIASVDSTDSKLMLQCYCYYEDGTNTALVNTATRQNFTIPDTAIGLKIRLYVGRSVTLTNAKAYPMIRKASVQNAEYKPYGYSLGIKAERKNLARVNNFSVTAQGTALDYTPINMPIGTYAIGLVTSATSGSADILFYNADKVEITKKNINLADFNARKTILFTVSSDISYMRVWTNTACDFTDFQIEPNTATPYEPYRSKSITIPLNEPLRKGDEIAVVEDLWGEDKGRGKVVLDGSDDEVYTYNSSLGTFWITLPNAKANSSNVLCTHYTDMGDTLSSANDYGFHMFSALHFRNKDASTLEEWRTILAENPITVQYELATPTFEPFEDQTPFYDLESFDTVTYISTDSEVEPNVILKFAKTEGDAVTLLNYNGMKIANIIAESNRARLDALEKSLQVV